MSEHIIETEMFGDTAFVTIPPKEPKEEIVRCRDCKHFFDWPYDGPRCSHWASTDLYPVVEPDGFCAWGERKEVDA